MNLSAYQNCHLCPQECSVNRSRGEKGKCGETDQLRIASVCSHHGEEPSISGIHGSGTVFLTGCSLGCVFCQNYDISCLHMGSYVSIQHVVGHLKVLYQREHIHNVNFVTPDHFIPHVLAIVEQLRKEDVNIPVVYNTSGYCRLSSIQAVESVVDIYMPDFKFGSVEAAKKLCEVEDYVDRAILALQEMVRQKGPLDVPLAQRSPAQRGVFVRHLVIPGFIDSSLDVLDLLYEQFGKEIPVHIMSQYWPVRQLNIKELNRRLFSEELQRVNEHALSLGFSNLLLQPMK